jgi:hypothetical protein
VIWLESGATTFTAVCHACLADLAADGGGLAYRGALLAGSLRPDADVGFTRCRRGHRLSVRRTTHAPLVAARG